MKWKTLAVGVACLFASACVPPPAGPSLNFVVSYVAPTTDSIVPGPFTSVQGTITNTGPYPADYTIQLVASSGEAESVTASNVLAGQTAVRFSRFLGDVTVNEAGVMSSPKPGLGPAAAAAVTTSHEAGPVVEGTVITTPALVSGNVAALERGWPFDPTSTKPNRKESDV